MNLKGSIEVHQDVSFQLDFKLACTLRESLATQLFPPWKTAPEWEEWLTTRQDFQADILAYSRDCVNETAAVNLCVFNKPPRDWYIPNVVTREFDERITVHEYNDIINEFVGLFLRPALKSLNTEIELTPQRLSLRNLMSEESARALKAFLTFGGGSAICLHPLDEQRLCKFIWTLHDRDPEFNSDRFQQWLEEGCSWSRQHSEELARRVDQGLVLLKENPGRSVAREAN